MPSCIQFLPSLDELVPIIFKAYHFINITSYCHFLFIMQLAFLMILLFYHTFPYRTPSFYRDFLFWLSFFFCCTSSFFFLSFTSSITTSFLLFIFCHNSLFFFISSPYLGRILSEFYLLVPRPNTPLGVNISSQLLVNHPWLVN